MEKEEAVALRDALEDMDLKKQQEEARIHAAAQDEASELVWQHQHPDSIRPDEPYKYKEHLRKNSYAHARTQSVGRYSGAGIVTGLARDTIPRSVSGGSSSSMEMPPQSRAPSRSSETPQNVKHFADESRQPIELVKEETMDQSLTRTVPKPYYGLPKTTSYSTHRRSIGKRNISGEPAGTFSGEQIWEEPEDLDTNRNPKQETRDAPAPLRLKPRNPLNRVQFARDLPPHDNSTNPEQTRRLSKYEIHKNPPSQSRNPLYTANPPISSADRGHPDLPRKDELEIRGNDIRQATSMLLKDRSPKLPVPSVVSNKPDRPIVSFDADWRPREADVKPVDEPGRPTFERRFEASRESKALHSIPSPETAPEASIPIIQLSEPTAVQVTGMSSPRIPMIACPLDSIPAINVPEIPTISVSDSTSIPGINIFSEEPVSTKRARPLPDPNKTSSKPVHREYSEPPAAKSRSHWSPAAGSRATVTCHQCDLPIEGRVVVLGGLSERFHSQCFICYICGTGLEALEISPEPVAKREERLSRIRRRAQGEQLEEIQGQTMAEDGDEKLRFYCHLDWHELYAPRCKHCKTPIIGEHVVALGEHWHSGHFFCAECGDPFEHGMTHIEKDGYAWCLNCQTKRTERKAPKCKKCRRPVIGLYVQALGGEYHDDCFRCANCSGSFDDGQIFPREENGEMVAICLGCIQRELKT
jgi:LIM domain